MSSARAAMALLALALASCEAPVAEVVLVVRADDALAPRLRAVRVAARRRGAAAAVLDRTFPIAQNPLPGRVAVIAADPDDARPLEVDVTADVGDPGRGDFTHRVVTRFQKNAVLYVDVLLAGVCTEVERRARCASVGLTCSEGGTCIPVDRPGTPSPPARDAGAPDAGLVCRPPATGPAPTAVPTCELVLDDAMERCGDGLDNDCDGRVDEGCCARSCAGATGAEATHCREESLTGGTFMLGEGESPGPTVTVSPFRIDAYEVTVARYRRFVAAGMPAPPAGAVMVPHGVIYPATGAGTPWPVLAARRSTDPAEDGGAGELYCNWRDTPTTWESVPINCLPWDAAMAFCVWDGGRLPTEAEWEYAARHRPLRTDTGVDIRPGRRYPWGDREPTCDDASFADCDRYERAHRPVGTASHGSGVQPPWLAIFDLAGNVEEFTLDHNEGYGSDCWRAGSRRFHPTDPVCFAPPPVPGNMVQLSPTTRGGSQYQAAEQVRTTARVGGHSRGSYGRDLGFRCVRMMR